VQTLNLRSFGFREVVRESQMLGSLQIPNKMFESENSS
jgi:hypothetical protein